MKIEEIKKLKELDVIAKETKKYENQHLTYEVYYVLFNSKKNNKIEVCQGYYENDTKKHIFLDFTRTTICYKDLLKEFDLIHKTQWK